MRNIRRWFTVANAMLLVLTFSVVVYKDLFAGNHEGVPVTPPVTPPTVSPSPSPSLTPTPTDKPEPTKAPKPDKPGKEKKVKEQANGGVKGEVGDVQFKLAFTAKNDGQPKGHVVYSNSLGSKLWGTVDICYLQEGNRAVFAGTILKTKGESSTGDYFIVEVEDNGEGKNSEADKAWLSVSATRPSCAFSGDLTGIATKGNIQVH